MQTRSVDTTGTLSCFLIFLLTLLNAPPFTGNIMKRHWSSVKAKSWNITEGLSRFQGRKLLCEVRHLQETLTHISTQILFSRKNCNRSTILTTMTFGKYLGTRYLRHLQSMQPTVIVLSATDTPAHFDTDNFLREKLQPTYNTEIQRP